MGYAKVVKVSGPLVVAKGLEQVRLYDTVSVSAYNLLGEIIEVRGDEASIQVFEETSGVKLGDRVISHHEPLSVELGPGLLSQILDGIGRDLKEMSAQFGTFLERGKHIAALNKEKKWEFHPLVAIGDQVESNDRLGYVIEHEEFKHYILVPSGVSGTITKIETGAHTVEECIACIEDKQITHNIKMLQKWPIRQGRQYKQKMLPSEPLVTGQRIIDSFFPIAKGGTGCIPGPFGSGKTVVQHQFAKWSNSDVVIYIGCGERGNEMTDVLNEFPAIMDAKTQRPLMEKMVLIANTSNMPVAAREASIYTGMSIAEYFRDMGYDVSLMADSTSRWAEALRDMSGRLGEMPGDEGYPAYLNSRLADVYERAGIVKVNGSKEIEGSVTMIGAVSPAGGDLSEPVTQATMQITKVFWALDAKLAYERHFPAISWTRSYSLYQEEVDRYMRKYVHRYFQKYRQDAMLLLKEEQRLLEIVQLIGKDTLSTQDLLKLEVAQMLREDFIQQNAFQKIDAFTSLKKQIAMLSVIMDFYWEAKEALMHDHLFIADILNIEAISQISQMKNIEESKLHEIETLKETLISSIQELKEKGDTSA